jgi:hypothetical protein
MPSARVAPLLQRDSGSNKAQMRKSFPVLLLVGAVLAVTGALSAQKLATEGMAWLSTHTQPAAVNVSGVWNAKEWGKITLNQAQDSREVTGNGDGWGITGVVSGKTVYLLFSGRGRVEYSAELTFESESSLDGKYCRFLMKKDSKTKPMHLAK